MRRKKRISTLLGMMATGAAMISKSPELRKMMPKIDKMVPNFKAKRNNGIGSMIASGILGFSLAHAIPKSKSMME